MMWGRDVSISVIKVVLLLLLALVAWPAAAHKLAPEGTAEERRLSDISSGWATSAERSLASWGVYVFGEPVHEEITDRIYGCDGIACNGRNILRAPPAVLAGVRWNDDPPFRIGSGEGRRTRCKVTQTIRFQTQPYCWYQLFDDASRKAAAGAVFDGRSHSALLYRSHFGDLQYLHAMATANDVEPVHTQRSIVEWAEFTWRIMLGEFDLGTELSDIAIPSITAGFGRSGWHVQDLFTLGSPGLRAHIQDVAFGSLLHTLQDSFAQGHVDRAGAVPSRTCAIGDLSMRAPGLVREFHAYNQQDHKLHASADTRSAFEDHIQDEPDVVEIGRFLLRAYQSRRPWEDVAPFFECIYALSPNARRSSPGVQFAKP